ncbi:MAG: hypothetical protein AAF528_13885 [Cyanobacteria bacterium P01_C01_bin.121]
MMFWLLAELVLNLVGLDNLADYSEFLLSGKQMAGRIDLTEFVRFSEKHPKPGSFSV